MAEKQKNLVDDTLGAEMDAIINVTSSALENSELDMQQSESQSKKN